MLGSLHLLGDDINGRNEKKLEKDKSCLEGCRCSEFPILHPTQLRCGKAQCRQRANEWWKDFAQRRVVSQHILPLLQRWHRGTRSDKAYGSEWVKRFICHAILAYSSTHWTMDASPPMTLGICRVESQVQEDFQHCWLISPCHKSFMVELEGPTLLHWHTNLFTDLLWSDFVHTVP